MNKNVSESMGAIRTRKLLCLAMLESMENQPFERISVINICEKALIPRATFYHYYDDKYDLLRDSIKRLENEIDPRSTVNLAPRDYYAMLFRNILSYIENNNKVFKKISVLNNNGVVFVELQNFIADDILRRLKENPNNLVSVPAEMFAQFYSSALVFTGKWWLEHDMPYPKEQVVEYLYKLIGTNNYFDEPNG